MGHMANFQFACESVCNAPTYREVNVIVSKAQRPITMGLCIFSKANKCKSNCGNKACVFNGL